MVSALMSWSPAGWTYLVFEDGLALEEGRVPGAEACDDAAVLAYLLRGRWPSLEAGNCRVQGRPAVARQVLPLGPRHAVPEVEQRRWADAPPSARGARRQGGPLASPPA